MIFSTIKKIKKILHYKFYNILQMFKNQDIFNSNVKECNLPSSEGHYKNVGQIAKFRVNSKSLGHLYNPDYSKLSFADYFHLFSS